MTTVKKNSDRNHLIKLLLYVARQEGAEVSATKLQKIFFLLEKEKGINLGLNFKPWFFGPFSPELQQDIDTLIELGEVDVKEEEIHDPISGLVVGYKWSYVLKGDFKATRNEKDIADFFIKKHLYFF